MSNDKRQSPPPVPHAALPHEPDALSDVDDLFFDIEDTVAELVDDAERLAVVLGPRDSSMGQVEDTAHGTIQKMGSAATRAIDATPMPGSVAPDRRDRLPVEPSAIALTPETPDLTDATPTAERAPALREMLVVEQLATSHSMKGAALRDMAGTLLHSHGESPARALCEDLVACHTDARTALEELGLGSLVCWGIGAGERALYACRRGGLLVVATSDNPREPRHAVLKRLSAWHADA